MSVGHLEGDIRFELVVPPYDLDLPAEYPALRVHMGGTELNAVEHVFRVGRRRPGVRVHNTDLEHGLRMDGPQRPIRKTGKNEA